MKAWKNTLEFKYFDHLYTSHRTTQATICQLRHQAQSVLEEADKLQKHHDRHVQDLHKFLPTITCQSFQTKLSCPMKVYPKGRSPSAPPKSSSSTSKLPPLQTQTTAPCYGFYPFSFTLHSSHDLLISCDSSIFLFFYFSFYLPLFTSYDSNAAPQHLVFIFFS